MKRSIAALGLLLCLLLPLSSEVLTIAIGEQPPLFSPKGGLVDGILAAALAAAGIEARFDWLPIGRMLELLGRDSLAVYATPSNTPGQQNPHVDLLEAHGVFFYLKSRFGNLRPARIEDLAGLRVATVVNSPLSAGFRKAGLIVDEGPMEALFAKLEAGRVDLAATADVGGLVAIKRDFPGRLAEFAFTELSYSRISVGFYVHDRPELLPLLAACRKGFLQIKRDGSLEKMLREFFGPEYWKRVTILE